MHLIQRHQESVQDYKNSVAWELIFDMFLYQRQLLAELTLPYEYEYEATDFPGLPKQPNGWDKQNHDTTPKQAKASQGKS